MEKHLEYIQAGKSYGVLVLIPTYNNASTLLQVIEEAQAYVEDVWVVNDGSTDGTYELLQNQAQIHCIHFEKNRGKGVALKHGLRAAFQAGFSYAITLDSDGQHKASDIPVFLKALETKPNTILVGIRNLEAPNMPKQNTFANKFSNFWFKLQTAQGLEDTQSGFRCYPLEGVSTLKYLSSRYEFELEVLVYGVWRGLHVEGVPIHVYYPPEGERVSHFRPGKDFFRISILNTYLSLIALLWYRPLLLLQALHPKRIKGTFKKILAQEMSNKDIALSIALGGFFGIIPLWGYQMLSVAGVAHVLKLNKTISLIASNISIPPMIPFILYGSVLMGAFAFGEPAPGFTLDLSIEDVKMQLKYYLVGSFLLASLYAVCSGAIAYLMLLIFRRKKQIEKNNEHI